MAHLSPEIAFRGSILDGSPDKQALSSKVLINTTQKEELFCQLHRAHPLKVGECVCGSLGWAMTRLTNPPGITSFKILKKLENVSVIAIKTWELLFQHSSKIQNLIAFSFIWWHCGCQICAIFLNLLNHWTREFLHPFCSSRGHGTPLTCLGFDLQK